MTTAILGTASPRADAATGASWVPLVVIVLAQLQMSFNLSALPVSIGPIAEDLNTPATSIATAMVVYSLVVAGLVMVGARLGSLLGARLVFQAAVIVHGIAMGIMALSVDARTMNNAQALGGAAAAALVPALVVLISANYRGRQQALALGVLAGTPAVSGALAFFVAGFLGTTVGWRYSFGLLVFLAIAVTILSFRLTPVPRAGRTRIDLVGAALAAAAVCLISFGFNSLNSWGLVLARPAAPFGLLGLSPAPFMVALGVVFGQGFFAWTRRRAAESKAPLLAPEVLDSPYERHAIIALLIVGALGPAVNFLIPLYIQIVQERSTLFTAVAAVPYTLALAIAAIFIVRFYGGLSLRVIGIAGFVLVAAGLMLLAFTVRGEWGKPVVVLSLLLIGLGEGALLTLLFNVMVALAPRELAGDVGALRGVANNLSTALGTAFASVVAVGLLGVMVTTALNRSDLPGSLRSQVDLQGITFVTNTHLKEVLSRTTATPDEVDAAVRINHESRLQALKASFVVLSGVALLAIFPATGLPKRLPGEAGEPRPPREADRAPLGNESHRNRPA